MPAFTAGATADAALAVAAAAAAAAAAATNTRSELNASCADYIIGRCWRGHLCPYGHTVTAPMALAAAYAAAMDPHMAAFGGVSLTSSGPGESVCHDHTMGACARHCRRRGS